MFDRLPSDVPTLPGYLSSKGIKTLGVSAMGNVSSTFGFDDAFDEFIDVYKHPDLLQERETINSGKLFIRAGEKPGVVNPTSKDLNEFVIPWIEKHSDDDFFIMVWSIDPHDPYDPENEFRKYSANQEDDKVPEYSDLSSASTADEVEWIKNRYDDLIYQNDHFFGELCNSLRELGIYDESLLLLTGDHGEAFGENGVFGHATTPIEPVTNVPLLLKLPEQDMSSTIIDETVGHIDIFPTVSGLIDQNHPELVQGKDLNRVLNGDTSLARNIYSRTKLRERAPEHLSVITDDYKYISDRTPEIKDLLEVTVHPRRIYSILNKAIRRLKKAETEYLFQISDQINEEINLAQKNPDITETLSEDIQQWLIECAKVNETIESNTTGIDAETKSQLKQMGYID